MEFKDLFLSPIYLLVLYLIATKIRDKHFPEHPFRRYFLPALSLKFFGAISAGLIYWFYYGYGDTRGFFLKGQYISGLIKEDFWKAFYLLFPVEKGSTPIEVLSTLMTLRAFDDPSSYFMFRISAFLSFFTFNSYTVIALLFAFFCFVCSLYLYKTLLRRFPELWKEISIAIFFIPSVFFWGSGLFKDSLTFAGLALFVGGLLNILERHKIPSSIALSLIGGILILKIKAYILLSMAPCIGLYVLLNFNKRIRSGIIRKLLFPVFLASGVVLGYFILEQVSTLSNQWSLDNIEKKAYDMQQWHDLVGEIYSGDGAGSHYSVGEIGDFSLSGMLTKLPLVLSITFYRPFIWEVRNPLMLLTSLEGLFFIWVTFKLFKNNGIRKVLIVIVENPIVSFCLLYAIIFGFAVGYTSFNYGALSRYKIPCLPFYLLFIYFSDYFAKKKYSKT